MVGISNNNVKSISSKKKSKLFRLRQRSSFALLCIKPALKQYFAAQIRKTQKHQIHLSGVYPETFRKMIKVLRAEKRKVRSRGGPKEKVSLPNQLLLCLEYLREYRTFFHIGPSYVVSETTVWRMQKWVEETLVHSGEFALPGKKVLQNPDTEIEAVLIDVTKLPNRL